MKVLAALVLILVGIDIFAISMDRFYRYSSKLWKVISIVTASILAVLYLIEFGIAHEWYQILGMSLYVLLIAFRCKLLYWLVQEEKDVTKCPSIIEVTCAVKDDDNCEKMIDTICDKQITG